MAIIHPDHIASRRVAEKIGMRKVKITMLDDDLAVIYGVRPLRARERV